MSMFDHLIRFTDETTARADPVVGQYYIPPSGENAGGWRGDVTIPNVLVTRTVAAVTTQDAGWFIVIALPKIDPNLQGLAGNACRLITDREAANAGKAFVNFLASDLTPSMLSQFSISPTFAGSRYPFHNIGPTAVVPPKV